MRWFLNLSTRGKLFIGFGAIVVILAAEILTAYWGLKSVQRSYLIAVEAGELRADLNRQRAQILEMMLNLEKSRVDQLEQDLQRLTAQSDQRLRTIAEEGKGDPEIGQWVSQIESTLAQYRQGRDIQIALIRDGKVEQARAMGVGNQEKWYKSIRTWAIELTHHATQEAQAKSGHAITISLTLGIVGLIVAVLLSALLGRVMGRPLRVMAGVAERIAQGDLRVDVTSNGRGDEAGKLARSFARMIENLRAVTSDLTDGAGVLGASANQIVASAAQLATGATQSATAVSETTTTVEEVRQTAQLASQKARDVSDRAQKAVTVSQAGKKSTESTVDAMSRIREQMDSIAQSTARLSDQGQAIGQIIATVDDLAQQSNLLAVNAAIEAAKAGEQGKGFSVVAQEVKSLAEQSKQATAQVRNILSDVRKATNAAVLATEQGTKAVEEGVRQSSQAGESIVSLTDGVVSAAQAAAQIAASSQQQLVGMDQIVQAMTSIKQASGQNVDSARQLESAARNLEALGQRLLEIVGRYQIAETAGSPATPSRPLAAASARPSSR
jgi:methyl-accepting chemotaxis protein